MPALTSFIETGNIRTTQFDLSKGDIEMLINNGETGVRECFTWFNNPASQPLNHVY
jgi:hypothetical protein